MSLNEVDRDKIEEARPQLELINKYGIGFGADGLVGVEIPVGSTLAFFAEGGVRLAYQLTTVDGGADDGSSLENLGGLTALGGIRIRF